MGKHKSPAFQFYVKDWLSSYKILSMTPAEEGGYIRLLAYCWDDEDCSLPDNAEILSRMSRLDEGYFKGTSTGIKSCFVPHPSKPGFLSNKRLLEEREAQQLRLERSRQGGLKSGMARKLKGTSRVLEGYLNTATASSSATAVSKQKIKTNTSVHFEKFWDAYPRKESKKRALESWKRKRLDEHADMVIADVLKRKVEHKPWTLGYTPHAVTYINQERWNDEIDNRPRNEQYPSDRPLSNTGAFYKECFDTLREINDAESENDETVHHIGKSI